MPFRGLTTFGWYLCLSAKLRHWGPAVTVSLLANFVLLQFFIWLISASGTIGAQPSALSVQLLPGTLPQPTPARMPAPEALKPKAKPKKNIIARQLSVPGKVKHVADKPARPAKHIEHITRVSKATVSKPSQVRQSTVTTAAVTDVMPLFRLTSMPKILDYNRELLKRYYPKLERNEGKEATVEAMILINAHGKVVDVNIIKSAGASFDAAAKKVLLSKVLTIQPAYLGNKPVAVRVPIPITFSLTD
jgi:TonB family protein